MCWLAFAPYEQARPCSPTLAAQSFFTVVVASSSLLTPHLLFY